MSNRFRLLQLIRAYAPKDRQQRLIKDRFINFIEAHDDCFHRSNLKGHITGSCWLLDPDENEVLLTHHKKIGSWLQLGGHADGDPDILRVALKEADEESGINGIVALHKDIFDLDIHEIPNHKEIPSHLHYDVRFILKAPHRDFNVSHESHALAWKSIREIAKEKTFDPSLNRMANKWLNSVNKKG